MLLGLGGTGKTMSTNRAGERASKGAPVERWMSRQTGGQTSVDEAEDRFASLIHAAEPPEGLSAVARARVWSRLRKRRSSPARLTRLRWSVALVVLLTSGVVLGALSARRWLPAKRVTIVPASTPTPTKPRIAHVARGLAAAAPQPAAPVDEPPPVDEPIPEAAPPAPHAAPAPARASTPPHTSRTPDRIVAISEAAPAAQPAPPAPARESTPPYTSRTPDRIAAASPSEHVAPVTPAAPSALSGETPLLGEALTRLRQKHDARGALATLDEYRTRYPSGALKREAEGARIDALLLLGRNDEALAELRALTFRPTGRDQELRLIRGELSAATNCADAVADFDRVLDEKTSLPLVERALHGRAACRLRLGDQAGAIQDLSEYLRRFPDGRFAPEARRIIDGRRLDL